MGEGKLKVENGGTAAPRISIPITYGQSFLGHSFLIYHGFNSNSSFKARCKEAEKSIFAFSACSFSQLGKVQFFFTLLLLSVRRSRGRQPAEMRSISKFLPKAKIWLRPCCGAVIVKGTFLTDRAAQANWASKHNHTLHKPMGAIHQRHQ